MRLIIAFATLLCASTACAITITDYRVWVDQSNDVTHFKVVFSQPPDFWTMDPLGRQANAFQFYIGNSRNPVMLLQSNKIPVDNLVSVREPSPPDPSDPYSGGWGRLDKEVAYTLQGDRIDFTTALSDLKVTYPFTYDLLACDYGGATTYIQGAISQNTVPEPSTLALVIVAVLLTACFAFRHSWPPFTFRSC